MGNTKMAPSGGPLIRFSVVLSCVFLSGNACADEWRISGALVPVEEGSGRDWKATQFSDLNVRPPLCNTFLCAGQSRDLAIEVFKGLEFQSLYRLELGAEVAIAERSPSADTGIGNVGPLADAEEDLSRNSHGFSFRGLVSFGLLDRFNIAGTLGASYWRSPYGEVSASGATEANSAGVPGASDGLSLTYGARLDYHATKNLGFRLAWDRFTNLGDAGIAVLPKERGARSGTDFDFDVYSMSVQYRFK